MSTVDSHGLNQVAAKLCQLHVVEQIHRLNIHPRIDIAPILQRCNFTKPGIMAEFSSSLLSSLLSTFDKEGKNMDNYVFCLEGFPSG